MSIRHNNTNRKSYVPDNGDLTNVRYTSIDRGPTRVFVTQERVPTIGPGVSLTKEIMSRPKQVLAPIKTFIDRDSDKYEKYMFDNYVYDTATINELANATNEQKSNKISSIAKNQKIKEKELEKQTLDKIQRVDSYTSTFQGSGNYYGNRIGGRKLTRIINEIKSVYGA